jgi:hypothetical protein
MYIRVLSAATTGLAAAKPIVGSPAQQCLGTSTVKIGHEHGNVMAPARYGRGTLFKSVGSHA